MIKTLIYTNAKNQTIKEAETHSFKCRHYKESIRNHLMA